MYYIEDEENLDFDVSIIKESLDKYLDYFKEDRDFSLHFISDEEIRELNNEYRDIDSPTDILTFRINDGEEFPNMGEEEELGDIFISLESMKRNAEEFKASAAEEMRRLLLHGLLHLRGMDHKTNDFSSEEMLILQEKLLKDFGFIDA